jgi:hypothetical protein
MRGSGSLASSLLFIYGPALHYEPLYVTVCDEQGGVLNVKKRKHGAWQSLDMILPELRRFSPERIRGNE